MSLFLPRDSVYPSTLVTALRVTALLGCLLPVSPAWSQAPPDLLRGVVRTEDQLPLEGVNVFVLETLEGAVTDSAGRFSIPTTEHGAATLVARRLGYRERRINLQLPRSEPLEIILAEEAVALEPLTVRAGSYAAGDEPDAKLSSLDVVTTPGAAADVFRALQTFPGLVPVDDGAGLFVRGGDVAETKVLLDGAVVLSPYRWESPTGGTFGAFDPLLLDGIHFSSGGFGAHHGDALSGIVDLRTLGRPARSEAGVTASLAAASANVALALPAGLGARATATRTSTGLLFRVNGQENDFERVPEGSDLSGSVAWQYRPTGTVKLFGIRQRDNLVVDFQEPSYTGAFSNEGDSDLLVLSGGDVIGDFAPSFSVSTSGRGLRQEFGAFRLRERERVRQGRLQVSWAPAASWTVTSGAELEQRISRLDGSLPEEADMAPGARTQLFASTVRGRRDAAFLETEWHPSERLRLTGGLRSDRSTLTRDRTADPRLAAALRLDGVTTLTLATGIYHQIPEPLFFEPTVGTPDLPPMRATHWIVGVQREKGATLARLELYHKRYRDLAQFTDQYEAAVGGRGTSTGADLFLKGHGLWGIQGRLAYGLLFARRTDPETAELARSPYDITHTLTVVGERTWRQRFRLGATYRHATGRPFTPVVGADYDSGQGVWNPRYDEPFSGRLPRFGRVDVAGSVLAQLWEDNLTVFFISLSNAFDRHNVSGYSYNADYTQRSAIRSPFPRSVYFGVTTSFPF